MQLGTGEALGFQYPSWQSRLLLIALAFPCAALLHEAGHFLAGIALGQRCLRFAIGPLELTRSGNRWGVHLNFRRFYGLVKLVPSTFAQFRCQRAVVAAGGPFASLIGGVSLLAVADCSRAGVLFWYWTFCAQLSLPGLAELVPFRFGRHRSDGWVLREAIQGGDAFDWVQRDSLVVSSDGTPLRVRDWPTEVIRRLAEAPADPQDHRYNLYLGYIHFLDRGDSQVAGQYLHRLVEGWTTEDPPEYALEAAYFFALGDHDLAAAGHWLSCASENQAPGVRLRAEAAVEWLSGGPEAARPIVDKALAMLRQAEACGSDQYEIDRLRALLEG